MGIHGGKTQDAWGISPSRIILAGDVLSWPAELLASFAGQYGSPTGYPLLVRAKLVGTYGVVARMLDVVQRNTVAPYASKNKPPQLILPEPEKNREQRRGYDKNELDDILGIGRHGAGVNDGEGFDSHSVDTGATVS